MPKEKKLREERLIPLAATPDNLKHSKEAGEEAQGTQSLSRNCTS